MPKKKFFVVSDIHGQCTLAQQALNQAGFDPDNEDHIFVHCGDLFDRGHENKMVFDFVLGIKNKILILGNHDERFREILKKRVVCDNDMWNGIQPTLYNFFGITTVEDDGVLHLEEHEELVSNIIDLIDSMRNYFETQNYVFVHGWIPLDEDDDRVPEHWRTADLDHWSDARWTSWLSVFRTATLPDKTIVCGHRATMHAYKVDPNRYYKDYSIFRAPGVIAIDACTIQSGQINVLVLEDDLIETQG